MKSVCVFGDSLAKGVVLDSIKNKYTFLKDSFLSLVSQKTGINFTNYSKFGCDIKKGRDIFLKHKEELCNYDFIFIEFGGNDCNFDWKSISEHPDEVHQPQTSLDEFENIYRGIVSDIMALDAHPVLLSLPPLDADKFFNWVSKGNSPENILKWLGDVDHIFRWHSSYNDVVCKLANELKVPLIDIRSTLLTKENYTDYICDDGMHLNKKGHKLISNKVAQFCTA